MNDVQTDAWGGKKIRAAIIEDELPAARLLQGMLAELRSQWDILLLPGTVEDAVQWFATHPHPDILFLDIQLTDGLSFYFIEQARPESMIVFTTAYNEYAVRAFTVNSIDYLLKPVRRERLADSLEKFERLTAPRIREQNERMDMQELLRMLADRNACPYRKRFLVNGARNLYTLAVDDVCYFYSEEKVTFAVTADRRTHIIDRPPHAHHRPAAYEAGRTARPAPLLSCQPPVHPFDRLYPRHRALLQRQDGGARHASL